MKLKIGVYSYIFKEKNLDEDIISNSSYEDLEIVIQKNLSGEVKKVVILKELFNTFFETAGYKCEDENVNGVLANQFCLFLKENKKFFNNYIFDNKIKT